MNIRNCTCISFLLLTTIGFLWMFGLGFNTRLNDADGQTSSIFISSLDVEKEAVIKFDAGLVMLDPSTPDKWPISKKFIIVNDSTNDVRVEVTGTSCGCADASFDRELMHSNETSNLIVRFVPGPESGVRAEACYVSTSLGHKLTFAIQATTQPTLNSIPAVTRMESVWNPVETKPSLAFDVVACYRVGSKHNKLSIQGEYEPLLLSLKTNYLAERDGLAFESTRVVVSFPPEIEYANFTPNQYRIGFRFGESVMWRELVFRHLELVKASPPQVFFNLGAIGGQSRKISLISNKPFQILETTSLEKQLGFSLVLQTAFNLSPERVFVHSS